MMQRNHPKSREGGLNKGQNEARAATRRPDGGYRFVPRGRLGVPGTPRLSEFIRGLHAPGKTFPGAAAGDPEGRRRVRRNAVTPAGPQWTRPLFRRRGGREISGENLFFYHSFLLFFVL